MLHAGLHRPWAEARCVDPIFHGDDAVLMPADVPIRGGAFVEEKAPDNKCWLSKKCRSNFAERIEKIRLLQSWRQVNHVSHRIHAVAPAEDRGFTAGVFKSAGKLRHCGFAEDIRNANDAVGVEVFEKRFDRLRRRCLGIALI